MPKVNVHLFQNQNQQYIAPGVSPISTSFVQARLRKTGSSAVHVLACWEIRMDIVALQEISSMTRWNVHVTIIKPNQPKANKFWKQENNGKKIVCNSLRTWRRYFYFILFIFSIRLIFLTMRFFQKNFQGSVFFFFKLKIEWMFNLASHAVLSGEVTSSP